MDFRKPDTYKTAAQIQKDFGLGDFRVERIIEIIHPGRNRKVKTEQGIYSFDNHPYCRDSREYPCIYTASEAGIYDNNGEFLVIFEPTPYSPKKGNRVIGTNPRPAGRQTAWLAPDGPIQGYVAEIKKSSVLLVNDAGEKLGYFSYIVPA
ncbi:MAG: hypothetical protein ACE5HX_05060 [bacterium]